MPEFTAPGIFVEAIERGPRPIEGVPTGTAAFLGETERGPTRPHLVTSYNQYRRLFGDGGGPETYLTPALVGFFENGGCRAYVCRIVGVESRTASRAAGGLNLCAAGPGAWGSRIHVKLGPAAAPQDKERRAARFRIQLAYWQTPAAQGEYSDPFLPGAGPPPTLTEDFDDLVWDDGSSPDHYRRRLRLGADPRRPGRSGRAGRTTRSAFRRTGRRHR
jgi:hypothetical protein